MQMSGTHVSSHQAMNTTSEPETAADSNIVRAQTVNFGADSYLKDASEIVENCIITVHTHMTFDCDDYRGLVQSETGCTVRIPNLVAPVRRKLESITSLRGLTAQKTVTDINNSSQMNEGNERHKSGQAYTCSHNDTNVESPIKYKIICNSHTHVDSMLSSLI